MYILSNIQCAPGTLFSLDKLGCVHPWDSECQPGGNEILLLSLHISILHVKAHKRFKYTFKTTLLLGLAFV